MGLGTSTADPRFRRIFDTDMVSGTAGIGGPASADHRFHCDGDFHATGDLLIEQGRGIALNKEPDKSMAWDDTADSWAFNRGLVINGNVTANTIIDDSIYAMLSSSVDQNPADTNPTVIEYNTQDAIAGVTHSTSVNPGEITIDVAGTYFVSPQPHVGKTSGVTADFDMFLQVDRGSGFADEVNSNAKLTIKDPGVLDVGTMSFAVELTAGDKIRMMQRVSSSSVGLGLKSAAAEVGPPTVPLTPSVVLEIHRVGGLAA